MGNQSRLDRLFSLLRKLQLPVFMALVLIRGCVFVLSIPPWQHPDEPTHFEHVRMIAETGRLPAPSDVSLPIRREIAASMLQHQFWRGIQQPTLDDKTLSTVGTSPLGIYTLTQPELYYIVAALWLKLWLGLPVDLQLYLVRMLSVLMSLIVITCGYFVARLLNPAQPYVATAVCAFLVFMPGYTDIMSAVSNDALVNSLGAVFILLMAFAFLKRRKWYVPVAVVVLAGATLMTAMAAKATALSLILALPLAWVAVGFIWALFLPSGHPVLRGGVTALLLVGVLGLVVAALAILGPLRDRFSAVLGWLAQYLRINLSGTLANVLSPQRVPYSLASDIVFRSFWAIFGWRHVYIAVPWYWLPGIATLAACAGLFRQAARSIGHIRHAGITVDQRRRILFFTFTFVTIAVAWVMAILRSQADQGMSAYQSHGRYIYVALVPFAVLFTQGILSLVKHAWRARATAVIALSIAAFDAVCFWGYLMPYYYR